MKTNKMFVMVLFALMVSIPSIAMTAPKYCDAIVVGASYASHYWPVVTNSAGKETIYSRNDVLNGDYRGVCDALGLFSESGKISCPAVAGSMSFNLNIEFKSVYISAPGFMTQFARGVKECTWNGKLYVRYIIISLANDGRNAIVSTQKLIDVVLNKGIKPKNILVQAYPTQMPNFQREQKTALEKHGPFWGAVINAYGSVPKPAEYVSLRNAHAQALKGYKGTRYLDFYKGIDMSGDNTFDGVHPTIAPQFRAALLIKAELQ